MRENQSKGSSFPDPFCDGSHLGLPCIQAPGVVKKTNLGKNCLTTRYGLTKTKGFAWNARWNCLKHSYLKLRPEAFASMGLLLVGTAGLWGQNIDGLTSQETTK